MSYTLPRTKKISEGRASFTRYAENKIKELVAAADAIDSGVWLEIYSYLFGIAREFLQPCLVLCFPKLG